MTLADSRRWLVLAMTAALAIIALAGNADATTADALCTVAPCHAAGEHHPGEDDTLPHEPCGPDHACATSMLLGGSAHLHAAPATATVLPAPAPGWYRNDVMAHHAGRLTAGGVERPPRFAH